MTLYNVHIYREMRLYFPGIEADTPQEAAAIAADRPTEDAACTEGCDGETLAALVDVAGDAEYAQSVTIDFEAERLRKAAPALLAALDYLLEQTVDMDLKHGIALSEGEQDARDQALAAIATATPEVSELAGGQQAAGRSCFAANGAVTPHLAFAASRGGACFPSSRLGSSQRAA